MTEIDENAITETAIALVDWFRSRHVAPPIAHVVMLRVIASHLFLKTQDPEKLSRMVDLIFDLLVVEVGSKLYHEGENDAQPKAH